MMDTEAVSTLSYASSSCATLCQRSESDVRIEVPFMREDAWLRSVPLLRIIIIFAGRPWWFNFSPIEAFVFLSTVVLLFEVLVYFVRKSRPIQRDMLRPSSIVLLNQQSLRCWNLRDEMFKGWPSNALPVIKVQKIWFSRKARIAMVEQRVAIYETAFADYDDVKWAVQELNEFADKLRRDQGR